MLTDAERAELVSLAQAADAGARVAQRARMVLLAAGGMRNQDIAQQLDMDARRFRAGASAMRSGGSRGLPANAARRAAIEG
ncbi:hypothetical protein AU476_38065 [Cupriavidus sp. UYMSc13B]|nr:hypothetical protein AU476_38065 [Cupriavidus sp. UYMSc13B]